MQKLEIVLLVFGLISPALLLQPVSTFAQAGDTGQLISEVNALREAYGLPAYEINDSLMSAAQTHSEYLASVSTLSHTGPGGSRPHDRAVAVGYGDGAQVFVSENIAMGFNLSPERTVNEIWQDAIHLETMTSPIYNHIGAGVSQADGLVYYTILVGYVSASQGSAAEGQPASGTEESGSPSVIQVAPIAIATPAADGSIRHLVQSGQYLENIANAYDVELSDLLALNGISDQTVIYPGDKLLIQAAPTPMQIIEQSITPTAEVEETISPTATRTMTPAEKTPSPESLAMNAAVQVSPTVKIDQAAAEPPGADQSARNVDFLLYAVIGFALAGTAMILFGSLMKKRA